MFTNIGKKIQLLARVLCFVGIVGAVIGGVLMVIYSREEVWGCVVAVVGPLFAWVSSWALYGFGVLIETNVTIANSLSSIGPQAVVSPTVWMCSQCGNQNNTTQRFCPKCGQSRPE